MSGREREAIYSALRRISQNLLVAVLISTEAHLSSWCNCLISRSMCSVNKFLREPMSGYAHESLTRNWSIRSEHVVVFVQAARIVIAAPAFSICQLRSAIELISQLIIWRLIRIGSSIDSFFWYCNAMVWTVSSAILPIQEPPIWSAKFFASNESQKLVMLAINQSPSLIFHKVLRCSWSLNKNRLQFQAMVGPRVSVKFA